MSRRLRATAVCSALAVALLVAGGCTRVPLRDAEPAGEYLDVEHKTVELEGADDLRARIEMPAGELKLGSGTDAAMDATFQYSETSWQQPAVDYSVEESTGVLSVSQPSIDSGLEMVGPGHIVWDIGLARDVPMDLNVKLGAGESTLDLSGLDVRRLDVLTGAGQTTIDLSGPREEDVAAVVTSGVGELLVRVARDAGVRVTLVGGGIGDFTADGFTKEGDTYVNDAYATSDAKVEILLHRGIGSFEVEMVD